MSKLPNGVIWYHVTSIDNIPSIIENGILPIEGKIYISNSIGRVMEMWEQMTEEGYKEQNTAGQILQLYYTKEVFIDEESDFDCYYITPTKPIKNFTLEFIV